jgi:predicted dehydrogenase
MFRVAAIGTGYWGPNLARNLHELGALALVCDLVTERAEQLAAKFGVGVESDFERVLERDDVHAVAIATPVATHHALALRALEAGKHVFVEKPLALTEADARHLCSVAASGGRTLMVGHLLHYHPAVTALQKLYEDGVLGEIKHIRCVRFNFGKLRSEENVLWSFAPHDLSLTLAFAGREPLGVRAAGLRVLGTPREDIVYADLDFGSFSAHVQVSWLEPIKQHQFALFGAKRIAVFNDVLKEGKLRLYDKGFDPLDGAFAMRDNGEEIVTIEPKEPMREELRDFLHCCRTGETPLASGEAAVKVIRTLERLTVALEPERTPDHVR